MFRWLVLTAGQGSPQVFGVQGASGQPGVRGDHEDAETTLPGIV